MKEINDALTEFEPIMKFVFRVAVIVLLAYAIAKLERIRIEMPEADLRPLAKDVSAIKDKIAPDPPTRPQPCVTLDCLPNPPK